MHDPKDKPPRGEQTLRAKLRELKKTVHRLSRRLEQLAEALDAIGFELHQLDTASATETPQPMLRSWHQKALIAVQEKAAAKRGAKTIAFEVAFDGSVSARIDGREVKLSPRLGALLAILADSDCQSEDHLVGWKGFSEIQARLEKKFGGRISKSSLHNLIWRLRRELRAQANLHEHFVQTNRDFGVRFALQRLRTAESESDRTIFP